MTIYSSWAWELLWVRRWLASSMRAQHMDTESGLPSCEGEIYTSSTISLSMFQSLKVPYRSNVPNFSIFRNDDLNNCAQGKRQRNTLNHFTATETQLQFTTTHTTQLYSTTMKHNWLYRQARVLTSNGKYTQIRLTINLDLNKEMITATMEMTCDTMAQRWIKN